MYQDGGDSLSTAKVGVANVAKTGQKERKKKRRFQNAMPNVNPNLLFHRTNQSTRILMPIYWAPNAIPSVQTSISCLAEQEPSTHLREPSANANANANNNYPSNSNLCAFIQQKLSLPLACRGKGKRSRDRNCKIRGKGLRHARRIQKRMYVRDAR